MQDEAEKKEEQEALDSTQENSSDTSFDSTLDAEEVDLNQEVNSEEEELLPPEEEKNEAKEINVGMILGLIFIGVALIIMLLMLFTSKKSKKKADQKELDKAGSKYEIEFKGKAPELPKEISVEEKNDENVKVTDENVDEILKNLPPEFQPPSQNQYQSGTAPVRAVGAGNYQSDRPDTRNSRSPRKIEGLKGQASPDTNRQIVSAAVNGGYNATPYGSYNSVPPQSAAGSMTKEEYITKMMNQSQAIKNQLYGGAGNGGSNQMAAYQQNKEQFYSNGYGESNNGQFLSYNSLWDGTVISGALITAINTDNPGVVIARVTENVYSSYDHSFLLIPEGSLLYATYNSSVSYGQNKVQVAWNLLIRPDGFRIILGNMNGVNAQGESGYKGRVNNHPFETLKALGIVAMYSVIQTEINKDIKSENNEYVKNAMSDVYSEASKIGNKIVDRALDIKPTIRVKAGTEIKLITNTPLELPPVQVNQVTRKYVRTK